MNTRIAKTHGPVESMNRNGSIHIV
jgi:hypothetical protein